MDGGGVAYRVEANTLEGADLRRAYLSDADLFDAYLSGADLSGADLGDAHLLEANGVVCWKDTHDMRGGDYYRRQINEAINRHDKLVLVCSERSTVRDGVIEEIVEAMELQERTHQMKLFPIRLDDFLFSDEMRAIAKEKTATGDWPKNWIAKICAFHVPDFSKWNQPEEYQKALQGLLRDLKQTVSE